MVHKITAQTSFTVINSNLSPLVQISSFFPAELEKNDNFVMRTNKDKSNIISLDT